MATVRVNFEKPIGVIKPMHAVNNGPVRQLTVDTGRRDNFESYKALHIPYARNHDASFAAIYGGEHCVDVQAVFPDFNANPYDPQSYDFDLTDDYLQNIKDAGTEVFYRLGHKIEHWRKKYGTVVPADAEKWAVICEHIIRHYNEGWANGFHLGIEYWEIWNEPDGVKSNGDQPNWSGTPAQFYNLYVKAATHLKACFPHLKIGGPAVSSVDNRQWINGLLDAMTKDGRHVPMDFFSWHIYTTDPNAIAADAKVVRDLLDSYGYHNAESILNEWNYVAGWSDRWTESILAMIGMRGAAYYAATMLKCQNEPVDMLMYYDARMCTMNGLFDIYTYAPLKGYFTFLMFSKLYLAKTACFCETDDKNVYAVAAKNDKEQYLMLAHYSVAQGVAPKEVAVQADGTWTAYYLDSDRTMAEETVVAKDGTLRLNLPENCVVLLKK